MKIFSHMEKWKILFEIVMLGITQVLPDNLQLSYWCIPENYASNASVITNYNCNAYLMKKITPLMLV